MDTNMANQLNIEIIRMQQGDFSNYQQFYSITANYIYKMILNILVEQNTANEIMSKTYNSIYQNINSLVNPDMFYQWAGKIATDLCLNHILMSRSVDFTMVQNEDTVDFVAAFQDTEKFIPGEVLQNMEIQRIIQNALDNMPTSCKLVMQYFYYEGMSVAEIALRMQTTEDDIKKCISYIKRTLKNILSGIPFNDRTQLRSMAEIPVLWVVFKNVIDITMGGAVAAGGATAAVAGGAAAGGGSAGVAAGSGTAVTMGTTATGTATGAMTATGTATGTMTATGTVTGAMATGAYAGGAAAGVAGFMGTFGGKIAIGILATAVVTAGGIAIHHAVTDDGSSDGSSGGPAVVATLEDYDTEVPGDEDSDSSTELVLEDREFYSIDIKSEAYWDDVYYNYSGWYDRVIIEGTDYPELSSAIDTWYVDYLEEYKQEEAVLMEDLAQLPDYTPVWLRCTLDIDRADDRVFSMYEIRDANDGVYNRVITNGITFDARTGTLLTLDDLGDIKDDLLNYVLTYIGDNGYGDMLHVESGYEELITQMVNDNTLHWWLTGDGMYVYFNYSDVIYENGDLAFIVPYDQLPGFEAKYLPAEGPRLTIIPAEGYYVDIDGNGTDELVRIDTYYEPDLPWSESLTVRVGDSSSQYSIMYESYVRYLYEADGKYYLIFSSNTEYSKGIHIFELTADGVASYNMFDCGQPGGDSISYYAGGKFYVNTHFDILGTYFSEVPCEFTAGGMTPTVSVYEFNNGPDVEYRHGPTTKSSVNVRLMQGDSLVDSVLPAGTTIYPINTDNVSTLGFYLEDGTYGELTFEKPEGDYQIYIDGIAEFELFENLPYAG